MKTPPQQATGYQKEDDPEPARSKLRGIVPKEIEAELLYQRGELPQATYIFKHTLVQEVAYQSLLKSTRQQVHQRIAQVLTEMFPDTVKAQPELLAHHATEAGLTEQAVEYWQRAGQHALQRSANIEAVAHFRQGLDLLKTLEEPLSAYSRN
jgi:predicted ATPase